VYISLSLELQKNKKKRKQLISREHTATVSYVGLIPLTNWSFFFLNKGMSSSPTKCIGAPSGVKISTGRTQTLTKKGRVCVKVCAQEFFFSFFLWVWVHCPRNASARPPVIKRASLSTRQPPCNWDQFPVRVCSYPFVYKPSVLALEKCVFFKRV